jgi:hypothetical protein
MMMMGKVAAPGQIAVDISVRADCNVFSLQSLPASVERFIATGIPQIVPELPRPRS